MTAYEEQLASIGSTAAVLAGIDEADHDTPVPACPGWSVGDVINHVAWQGPPGWIALMRGADPRGAIAEAVAARPSIEGSLVVLIKQLRSHDPSEPCPVFFGEGDYSFWGVHCSVEIALHRCDVLAALGRRADLEPSEARDGLVWSSHLLEPMVGFLQDGAPTGALAVVPTSGEAIQLGSGEPASTATGDAADLVFWLWGRDRGGVEVTGDAAVADAWSSISGRSFQHEAIR